MERHGEKRTRLYKVWRGMKERCLYSWHQSYKNYGGRGIKVCPEWSNSFVAFRNWAMANGYDPNAKKGECTIDRIDVNGDYEPSNCRWVNAKVQCNNRRSNHLLTYNGETHTITEWSEITGLTYDTIIVRLKHGWSIEDVLNIPVRRSEEETLNEMLEFMRQREWFTREELSKATNIEKVDRYLVRLQELGHTFVKEWEYNGIPAGFRNRHRLYKLIQ
jgi:hypothetical protein